MGKPRSQPARQQRHDRFRRTSSRLAKVVNDSALTAANQGAGESSRPPEFNGCGLRTDMHPRTPIRPGKNPAAGGLGNWSRVWREATVFHRGPSGPPWNFTEQGTRLGEPPPKAVPTDGRPGAESAKHLTTMDQLAALVLSFAEINAGNGERHPRQSRRDYQPASGDRPPRGSQERNQWR